MKQKNEVIVTEALEKSEQFGWITRLEFPNGSKIYVSKKGLTFVVNDANGKHEMTSTWAELDLAMGYRRQK